jgi:hypothetical protein
MKKTINIMALTLAMMAGSAHATTISVNYADFSDVSQWQLNGDAANLTTNADNTLRLTQGTGQAGSAFFMDTFSLLDQASFSSFFSFRMFDNVGAGDEDGTGADGLVFALQPISNTAGGGGGGIGYDGIGNSLGIEFDTYNNADVDGFNGNHAGINIGGSVDSVARINELTRFNNGQLWNVWIDYDGVTDLLELGYGMNENRPEFSALNTIIDLESVFGSSNLFAGFTSGTGAAGATHDITRFSFVNSFQPIEGTSAAEVSEPSLLALMGLSLLAIGRLTRKKS